MNNMINQIAVRTAKANPPAPDDFVGEDGLLRCGKCGGKKQTIVPLEGNSVKVACACLCQKAQAKRESEADERSQRFKGALESPVYSLRCRAKSSFADHDGSNPNALKAARRYAEKWPTMRASGYGLNLCGGVGTGKSFLAGCIVNALLEQEIPALMIDTSTLLNYITRRDIDENEVLKSLQRFDLLVLDDFGAERQTEFIQEALKHVVDARAESGLPMIITTNIAPAKLHEPTPDVERVYDRVSDLPAIQLTGTSKRKERAEKRLAELQAILFAN